MGMTASQFRSSFSGAALLDRFCASLILPCRETLRGFDPLEDRARLTRLIHGAAARCPGPATGSGEHRQRVAAGRVA